MAGLSLNLHWFWIFWAGTVALVLSQLVRAWYNREEVLGFPTVAGLMWSYFYILQPFSLVRHSPGLVPSGILAQAQLQALLAYGSLLAGWHLYLRRHPLITANTRAPIFDLDRLWLWGVGFQIVGLASYYSFRSSGRSFEETSAYWYSAMHLCYPGMSLCMAVLVISPSRRSLFKYILLGALSAQIIWPFLYGARRGPTFVAIIALAFSYFMARPKLVKSAHVFGTLIGAGLIVLCLVTARNVLYQEGGTWTAAFETLTFKEVTKDRLKGTGDNEFVNHCTQIQANLETGRYQYGTAHLAILVHWIPRSWWPGKPFHGDGFLPAAIENYDDISEGNLGHGGAIAAVADSFNNYGWYLPLYWALIGWGVAVVYTRAVHRNSLQWKLHYVGLLCASHWFIAQSLAEASVPALCYQAAYFVAFRGSRLSAQTQGRRRPLRRPAQSSAPRTA